MTADLTPAERATVDRFDAAVPAPESLRERVAEAIFLAANPIPTYWSWVVADEETRNRYRKWASAAIRVITGGAS